MDDGVDHRRLTQGVVVEESDPVTGIVGFGSVAKAMENIEVQGFDEGGLADSGLLVSTLIPLIPPETNTSPVLVEKMLFFAVMLSPAGGLEPSTKMGLISAGGWQSTEIIAAVAQQAAP